MRDGELQIVLTDHLKKYPKMQAADFIKLIYQNEFGGAHLAASCGGKSLMMLQEERCLPSLAGRGKTCFEYVGNGRFRMHFSGSGAGEISDETLNGLFLSGTKFADGRADRFAAKLAFLEQLCRGGHFPFPADLLSAGLEEYRKGGIHPVSHSRIFRENYHPAYRVVPKICFHFFPLFLKIDRLLAKQGTATIAIEGGCCSGKTTLARFLHSVYDCNVIPTDDFFLPSGMRTPERMGGAGAGIHYERFREEVAQKINTGKPFQYGKFDCQSDSVVEQIPVLPKRVNVVEGVYSMHPLLGMSYDLAVFLSVSPEEQAERILLRETPERRRFFFDVWLPRDRVYFNAFHPENRCSLQFYGD